MITDEQYKALEDFGHTHIKPSMQNLHYYKGNLSKILNDICFYVKNDPILEPIFKVDVYCYLKAPDNITLSKSENMEDLFNIVADFVKHPETNIENVLKVYVLVKDNGDSAYLYLQLYTWEIDKVTAAPVLMLTGSYGKVVDKNKDKYLQ